MGVMDLLLAASLLGAVALVWLIAGTIYVLIN